MALEFSYPDVSGHPDFDNHERVLMATDPDIGFKAFLAIHNTLFGPARGGCRYWPNYASEQAALNDALRLSRGMTFKNTLAGLPHGGGKTVIMGVPGTKNPSPEIMRAIGHALNELGGIYETGEDVGTSPEDFRIAREITEFVRIRSLDEVEDDTLAGGDPSPYTSYGIYCGILAAVKHKFGQDHVKGLRFAVKGLGHVSQPLSEMLHRDGAELIVTDLDPAKVAYAENNWNAKAVSPDEIISQDADVYVPCALGGDINDETIDQLKVQVIAGAANNQLADPSKHAQTLHERGILYAPDYAINAGGVINVVLTGQPKNEVMARVANIEKTLAEIFRRSETEDRNTAEIADMIVYERLNAHKNQQAAAAE